MFYLSCQKWQMRILLVTATEQEIAPLISDFGISIPESGKIYKGKSRVEAKNPSIKSEIENSKFEILVTGVGMVATAFELGKHLAVNKYDVAINLGIAGSFDHSIALGDVLEITEDTFSELGAEDDTDFLSIEKLGFGGGTFNATSRLSGAIDLKTVTAITVNTVHGNEYSIRKLSSRLNPQLESMEGAAFFYACHKMNLPCLQIRAVSNYVEKRNRDKWKIGLAIKNLNNFASEFLSSPI